MRPLTIRTPNGDLRYTIAYRARVTRRLHMEVDEDGGLVVVAPRHWSKRQIKATLSENTPRVVRFLDWARERHQQSLHYVHGEMHYFLGESYPLLISPAAGLRSAVLLTGGAIRVEIGHKNSGNIQALLHGWYRRQAMRVLGERLELIKRRAAWARDSTVPLKLRRMKRTWGNCSSRGVIKLNTHLVKAPLPLIDSVIAHELCHLKEMNHSKAFYALLEGLNPTWKQDRQQLKSDGLKYLT